MELFYCAGGNKRFAEIAIRYGFSYGAQLPSTVYFPPAFADQNWKKPNREKYLAALDKHRPRIASVLDLEREDQFDEVLAWAHEVSLLVTEAVIIIPKVMGIITKLPREINGKSVRLGYSVPTKYGGTQVPAWEFVDWPIHALGSSPQKQAEVFQYLNVVSVDGNYAQKMATQYNQFFVPGVSTQSQNRWWPRLDDHYAGGIKQDAPYMAFELSCMNIKAFFAGCKSGLRFATENDLPQIKTIANQYKNELGYVMYPALRESIQRKNLIVAFFGNRVVGFVNYRARKDGKQTIYEIAAHKHFTGQHIGQGLLCAVPKPLQLKCTVDNPANDFYAKMGMQLVGTEQGRKRPLNLWSMV